MNQGSDNYCAPLFAGNDLLSQFFCSNNSSSSALTSNQLAASSSILSFSIMPTPIVTVDSNINDHSKANGKASLQVNKCRLSTGLLEDVVKQACYKHSPFIHPFDLNHNQETEFTKANESDDDLLINPDYDHVSNSHSLIDNSDIDAVICNRLSSKYADYDEEQASCVKHAFLQLPALISVDTIADEGRMQSTHINPDYHSITGPIHHSKPQYNSEFSRLSWLSDLPHTDNVDSYSPAQYLGIVEQSTSAFYGCKELYDGPVHDASPLYSSADIADIRIAHASDVADMHLNGADDDDNTPATSISVPASHILSVTHESRELSDHGKTEVCYLPHNVSHLYAALRPADHVADKWIPDQSVATADVRGRTRNATRLPVGLLQASRSFNIDQVEQVPESLSSSLNWLQYRGLAPQRDRSHGDSLGSLSNIQNNLHECARCSYAKEESIKLCKMTAFLDDKKHQAIDDYCIDLNSLPDQQIVGPNCRSSTEQLQLLFDQKTLHHASEKAPISPTCKLFRSSFAERLASPRPSTLSEEPLKLRTSSDRICVQYSALLRNQIASAETYNKHDGRTGGLCKENLHLSGEYSDHIMCAHSLFRNRAAGSAIPRIEDAGVQATSSSLIISNIPCSHSAQKSLAATSSGYHKRTASAVLDDAVDAYTNWSRISSSPQTKRQRITSSVFNSAAPTGGGTDHLRSDCQLASDVLAGNHVTLSSNNICELQPSAYACMETEAGNIDVESKIKLYKQKLANQASEAPLDRFAASMADVLTSNDCTTSQSCPTISSSAVSPSTSPTATIRVPFQSAPFCPNHVVLLQSDAHVMEIAIDDEINRRGGRTVSKMLMKEVRPSTETVPVLTKSSDEFGERGILGCCCCSGEGVPGALASPGAKIQNHGSSIRLNGRRCAAMS